MLRGPGCQICFCTLNRQLGLSSAWNLTKPTSLFIFLNFTSLKHFLIPIWLAVRYMRVSLNSSPPQSNLARGHWVTFELENINTMMWFPKEETWSVINPVFQDIQGYDLIHQSTMSLTFSREFWARSPLPLEGTAQILAPRFLSD